MAREYGALLKWPKELEKDLGDLMGQPAILTLEITLAGDEPLQRHIVNVDGKLTKTEYFDEIYNKCFEHINPVKARYIKGEIKSFVRA